MRHKRLCTNRQSKISRTVTPIPRACHATISTHDENPYFMLDSNCNRLAYIIFEASAIHEFSLFAFCIMPDHVHVLCQPGNIITSHYINMIKFRCEYMLGETGQKGPIWQVEFSEQPLADDEVLSAAVFIYENPVRRGIVKDASNYPYSYVYKAKEYRP